MSNLGEPMLTPSPACCDVWASLIGTFRWLSFQDYPHLSAMPFIYADGRQLRVNFCPSCGQPRRDVIVTTTAVLDAEVSRG